MTQTQSRRFSFVALLLTLALVMAAASSAVTLGAQGKNKKNAKTTNEPAVAASPAAEASPTPSPEPTPEPTPFPMFDPASVGLRIDLLTDGLNAPVYLTDDRAPGGCLYVVEQGGMVRIVEADTGYLRPAPFLDISKLVATGPEQGLHSIAFHPKFRKNGRFFVHYNRPDNASVIAEFKGKPCASAGNKPVKTLLTVDQEFPNNNAGWIGFGRDGYLYIPLGDGGGRSPGDPNGYGQTKSTRLSKVLRIDVNKGRRYVVPQDNPYAKKKMGFPPEAWAWGLRDPRRASFDRKTGDLWIGDVGQDRHEEIDLIPVGATTKGAALNFGWSDVEGYASCHPNVPECDPSLYEEPVWSYDKVPPHRAVTGGYVYRGKAIPELFGVYLFSDFASGYLWALDAEAVYEGLDVTAELLLDAPQGFVSFGQDDSGELYLVSFDGSVYRLNRAES